MSERNWSTKTLARELLKFLRTADLDAAATVDDLLDVLKDQIVEDEVGATLTNWKGV